MNKQCENLAAEIIKESKTLMDEEYWKEKETPEGEYKENVASRLMDRLETAIGRYELYDCKIPNKEDWDSAKNEIDFVYSYRLIKKYPEKADRIGKKLISNLEGL